LQEAALHSLAGMPDGDAPCHGDLHPRNILMTPRGPVIIDWIDATRGNPLADLARSLLLLAQTTRSCASPPRDSVARRFLAGYQRRYFQLRPAGREQLAAWRPIVAAARLSENIPQERDWLLSLLQASLP
jgi:Ser/Thr protein kinase RdoA (MazF antagonist)